jgi:hypothetical protein
MTVYHAQCSCGTVRIEAEGEPVVQCYCHCTTCRGFTGAPVNAVALWPRDKVRFVSGEADVRRFCRDGGRAERMTCARCGGCLGADLPYTGLIDLFAGLVRGLEFRPTAHFNYENTVLPIRDGLPKFRDMPEQSGGSGELMAE